MTDPLVIDIFKADEAGQSDQQKEDYQPKEEQ
jgi:hypothetical protein